MVELKIRKVEPKTEPLPQPKPRTRAEPTEKKEKIDTSSWIKCSKDEHDAFIELRATLRRLTKWKRLDPENEDNIKHNRQEPALLKKGVELMEKIL